MKPVIFVLAILLYFPLQAKIGCMDNSKHTDTTDGYDYKTYHYVACNCPCDRYAQSPNRARCEKCWHYHAPSEKFIIRYQSVHTASKKG